MGATSRYRPPVCSSFSMSRAIAGPNSPTLTKRSTSSTATGSRVVATRSSDCRGQGPSVVRPLFFVRRGPRGSTRRLELINVLYAFRLDFDADARRFQEFGCPPFLLPTEDHEFMFWSKAQDRHHVYGPYSLSL